MTWQDRVILEQITILLQERQDLVDDGTFPRKRLEILGWLSDPHEEDRIQQEKESQSQLELKRYSSSNYSDDPDLTVNKRKKKKPANVNLTRFAQWHDNIANDYNQKLINKHPSNF
jgi:hypothetical protein